MYDELVKRLKYAADIASLTHPTWTALMTEAADAIEELEKQLENETEYATALNSYVPQWVPVTDQLPDGRESVLALTGDCDIYVCDYIPSVKQFWTIPGDELHIDDITHWMPLPPSPEPPKEET